MARMTTYASALVHRVWETRSGRSLVIVGLYHFEVSPRDGRRSLTVGWEGPGGDGSG